MGQYVINYLVGVFIFFSITLFANLFLIKKEHAHITQYIIILFFPILQLGVNYFEISLLNLVVSITLYIIMSVILFQGKILKKSLVAFLATLILAFCENMVGTLISYNTITTDKLFINTMASLAGTVVFLIVIWIVRFSINLSNKKTSNSKFASNYTTLVLLLLTVCTAIFTNVLESKTQQAGLNISMYCMIFLIVFIVVDIIVIVGNEYDYRKFVAERDFISMQLQEMQQASFITQQADYMERMESQVHDFKNHLYLLQSLFKKECEDNISDELNAYIEDLIADCQNHTNFPKVKNNALKIILSNTMNICEENNIQLKTQIGYSSFDFMTFQEICTLFMNAFDNAVEACIKQDGKSEKSIEISINRQHRVVLVAVKNTYCTPIVENAIGLQTSKNNSLYHGIGLKNMQRIVDLYNGDILYEYDENMFSLTICLNIM